VRFLRAQTTSAGEVMEIMLDRPGPVTGIGDDGRPRSACRKSFAKTRGYGLALGSLRFTSRADSSSVSASIVARSEGKNSFATSALMRSGAGEKSKVWSRRVIPNKGCFPDLKSSIQASVLALRWIGNVSDSGAGAKKTRFCCARNDNGTDATAPRDLSSARASRNRTQIRQQSRYKMPTLWEFSI
jgi:hypothetical protein